MPCKDEAELIQALDQRVHDNVSSLTLAPSARQADPIPKRAAERAQFPERQDQDSIKPACGNENGQKKQTTKKRLQSLPQA